MPKEKHTLYELTLKSIESNLSGMRQWSKSEHFGFAIKYQNQAEALIELLEIFNCGSVGGFDHWNAMNQEDISKYHNSLDGRLKWLKMRKP